MPDNEDRSLISLHDGSLANTAVGAQRIMSAMVGEMLALTRQEQAGIQSAKRKIGDYEFCDPDYRQILLWAEAMSLEPLTVIERLLDDGTLFGLGEPGHSTDWTLTRFSNGRIETLYWDRRQLPLRKFEWVEGLEITSFAFSNEYQPPWKITALSLPLPKLRFLLCAHLGITELDLSLVPSLTTLDCRCTQITKLDLSRVPNLTLLCCATTKIDELDLSCVPNLTSLDCDFTQIAELDLSRVPNLMFLFCWDTQITKLDLSRVPNLTTLNCQGTQISELDIRSCENLSWLNYDEEQTKLIQRDDQDF